MFMKAVSFITSPDISSKIGLRDAGKGRRKTPAPDKWITSFYEVLVMSDMPSSSVIIMMPTD
jgi:hypothetical protein